MLPAELIAPPAEFSLCPFWFWNDRLMPDEILRQIDDFQQHGVDAFVIHPRVGLPPDQGWMSPQLLDMMRLAIEEAARRGMWVVLYDEGMYPSGSASGRVVAANPDFQCHGLVRIPCGTDPGGAEVLDSDEEWQVVVRPIDSVIRGLHYVGDGPEEETPPAADLLNPDAMQEFIRQVYDRYFEAFGAHFGRTIRGIFTDEPSLLGRPREPDRMPGTLGILEHVHRLTGEDLRGRLSRIWDSESPERATYELGLRKRLEETFYRPLSDWCRDHGIDLMGHPEHPDDLSALAHFQVPGQDLVWRWVLPGPTAIEGRQSTQAKAAESAMVYGGKRRNSNELAGAYGHELTFAELRWLVYWCAVRGTNLFFPHAFYYSTRGPRRDERPPDVGPHSDWWPLFPAFAVACRRLAWINTDSTPFCPVAIPENVDGTLPWEPAKALFQRQIDFHYVPREALDQVRSNYPWIIGETELETILNEAPRSLEVPIHPDLRVRRVRKGDTDYYLLHNEGYTVLELPLPAEMVHFDLETGESQAVREIVLPPLELRVLLSR